MNFEVGDTVVYKKYTAYPHKYPARNLGSYQDSIGIILKVLNNKDIFDICEEEYYNNPKTMAYLWFSFKDCLVHLVFKREIDLYEKQT